MERRTWSADFQVGSPPPCGDSRHFQKGEKRREEKEREKKARRLRRISAEPT
jgi:hypothetical protein